MNTVILKRGEVMVVAYIWMINFRCTVLRHQWSNSWSVKRFGNISSCLFSPVLTDWKNLAWEKNSDGKRGVRTKQWNSSEVEDFVLTRRLAVKRFSQASFSNPSKLEKQARADVFESFYRSRIASLVTEIGPPEVDDLYICHHWHFSTF